MSAVRCVACGVHVATVRTMYLLGSKTPMEICASASSNLCEWNFPKPLLPKPSLQPRYTFQPPGFHPWGRGPVVREDKWRKQRGRRAREGKGDKRRKGRKGGRKK